MFRERCEGVEVQKYPLGDFRFRQRDCQLDQHALRVLLSSIGPIKVPLYCLRDGVQSVEIACDTLLCGKAKVLAGGYVNLNQEGSYEFAQMQATSNAEFESATGREAAELSRPTAMATSRAPCVHP